MVRGLILLSVLAMGQEPVATQAAAPVNAAEKVDLCNLLASGHSFFGHYLEVTGSVAGEQPDHLRVISPKCDAGLTLGFSPDVKEHEDVRTLFAALGNAGAGTAVQVDVEGSLLFAEDGTIVRLQVDRVNRLTYPKH